MIHDIVIIGAGPAGLMAGWLLKKEGINFKIIDCGKEYQQRDKAESSDVSYGFGGAGLFSDGKLSYAPSASNLWTQLKPEILRDIYRELIEIFNEIDIELCDWNDEWLVSGLINSNGIKKYESIFLNQEQRERMLDLFFSKLCNNVSLQERVTDIQLSNEKYKIICNNGKTFLAKNIIIATGKASNWGLLKNIASIKWKYCAEMGVRVEVPTESFLPANEDSLDYKIITTIDDSTELRTFCSCKKGVVRKSIFDNHITFNGEAASVSRKSNIGIVLRTTDSSSIYAKEIKECYEKCLDRSISLTQYCNGNYIIGLNVDNLIIESLYTVISECSQGTVYGPEIEKYGSYPILEKDLCVNNSMYFAGDSSGTFRGLMAAFLSGGYVASILLNSKKKNISIHMDKLKIKKSDTQEMKLVFTAQSKAYFYCKDTVCQFVLERGYLPINPFRVFDYFLHDRVDRQLIRCGNNQLIRTCEELWVFGTIADGVLFEIASAIEQGKKIRFFTIGSRIEEIKELSIAELTFEPEVHAKQIKKQDILDFISKGNFYSADEKHQQVHLFDFLP